MSLISDGQTVAHCLHRAIHVYQDQPFLGLRIQDTSKPFHKGNWVDTENFEWLTYRQVGEMSKKLACTLANTLAIPSRSFVGICFPNRIEWLASDFACTFNNYISIGLHTSWPVEDVVRIVNDSQMACVIVDHNKAAEYVRIADQGNCPSLKTLVIVGGSYSGVVSQTIQIVNLAEAIDRAQHQHSCTTHSGQGVDFDVIDTHTPIDNEVLEQIFTLLYTSGTSGEPKAIVVNQKRWINDAVSSSVGKLDPKVVCSHMALAHGGDRGVCWQALFVGGRVGFARSHSHALLLEDLASIRPTFFLAMSHFWNRIYVDFQVELRELLKDFLRDELRKTAFIQAESDSDRQDHMLTEAEELAAWDDLVDEVTKLRWAAEVKEQLLKKTRDTLGDQNLIRAITGGAHTSDKVMEFMKLLMARGNENGVQNAYGSTEFPGISVNGEISEMIDLKLIDVPEMDYYNSDKPHPRGEILVRKKDADAMTTSYYNRDQASASTWIDGWYHTGDIGMLEYHDSSHKTSPLLHIIDRRKNLTEMYIKGRSVWVGTASLEENVYRQAIGVHQVFLVSDRNASKMVAIVVPRREFVAKWMKDLGLQASDPTSLYNHPGLAKTILRSLRDTGVAKKVEDHEIPGQVIIESESWTIANGFLTGVGKLKRGALTKKYEKQLADMHAKLERLDEKVDTNTELMEEKVALVDLDGLQQAVDQVLDQLKEQVKEEGKEKILWQKRYKDAEWVTEFEFELPDEADQKRVNEAWHDYRSCALEMRETKEKCLAERKATTNAAFEVLEKLKIDHHQKVLEHVNKVLAHHNNRWAVYYTEDTKNKESSISEVSLSTLVADLIQALKQRHAAITTQYLRIGTIRDVPHLADLQYRFNRARDNLEVVARACGTRVPYDLTGSIRWVFPPEDGGESDYGIPVGEAKIWCDVCGWLVEETFEDEGKERYHCLDCNNKDQCGSCYHILRQITEIVAAAAISGVPGADAAMRLLTDFNPHMHHPMAADVLHITHLQDRTKKFPMSDDTPAGLLLAACVNYHDRLALGIPDPNKLSFFSDDDFSTNPFPSSAIANAAKLQLRSYDKYLWLTYKQLGFLVDRVARGLTSLEVKQQFVGLSGYNNYEWAVADFATMASSNAVVGLHTTYTCPTIVSIINQAGLRALFLTSNLLSSQPFGEDRKSKGLWTLMDILADCPTLKQIIVMDLCQEQIEAHMEPYQNELQELKQVSFYSMCDWVDPSDTTLDATTLPDPYSCRGVKCKLADGSESDVVTLLFTSGSSGVPKGVMVSPYSFVSDISQRSFASPLVTISYIPLSHSSDRMKLWEFMGNGGRVGFAYYDAKNWEAHEKTKKDDMISSLGSTNNVLGLFRQVQALAPSAMSCPPRIWNGLYTIFQSRVRGLVAQVGVEHVEQVKATIRADLAKLFGRRIGFVATGGAPTAAEVMDFVKLMLPRVNLVDSYGTTESGAITSNGKPLRDKNVQVKLLEYKNLGFSPNNDPPRGEILVKTPSLSLGYLKKHEKTKEVYLDDGWYRTGDLGEYDTDSHTYKVLERISAVGSLANGTIISPNRLQSCYQQSKYVDQVCIQFNPKFNYIAAVVVLNSNEVAKIAADSGEFSKDQALEAPNSCPAFLNVLYQDLNRLHTETKQKGDFVLKHDTLIIAREPFSVDNGQMTGSLKVMIKKIAKAYEFDLKQCFK